MRNFDTFIFDFREGEMEISGQVDLKGRVAIVTGAARGIGRAIALALGREGADIVIADVTNAETTRQTIEKLGRQALAVKTDVSQKADVVQMIEKSINIFGKVDILVNNAGTCHRVTLEDISEEQWDRDIGHHPEGGLFLRSSDPPTHEETGLRQDSQYQFHIRQDRRRCF